MPSTNGQTRHSKNSALRLRQMLGCCVRRLNKRVTALRAEMKADANELETCLQKGYAFQLKEKDLAHELLLDMDSFLFETRSLYEILGKFLVRLFQTLFARKLTEDDLQSILSDKGIDTRWIAELRESRKLLFHETVPWLAVQVRVAQGSFGPVLVKRHIVTFGGPDSFVNFETLRQIYDGFVDSITELHRFVLEQIRLAES
jgi:hypothetical protein